MTWQGPISGVGGGDSSCQPPYTVHPDYMVTTQSISAGQVFMGRNRGSATNISQIGCFCTATANNIVVGVYSSSGLWGQPGTRVGTSLPTAATVGTFQLIPLLNPVWVDETAYLAITSDVGGTFMSSGITPNGVAAVALGTFDGFNYFSGGGGASLPAVATGGNNIRGNNIALFGR
jgi:hypothetical protein